MASFPRLSSRLPIARASRRPESESKQKEENKYRSKHYNASSASSNSASKILLEPHVLSARLKKLCDQNQIDMAVAMLKNSPLDAQNVPVWNTLIWECLKAERFRLAYELYIDMKRRGHRPNTRTFQTLMNGLARIENWDAHTKQLEHAHLVYKAFMRHVEHVKQHDPSSAEISVGPLAAYVKILGGAELHQEIFDVYYSLDSEGPFSPDHLLFTAMFQALSLRPTTQSGDLVQNAASAKLLWNLMLKARRKTNFPIDGYVVSSAIVALSRGSPPNQEFAFSLVEEYFGLFFDDGSEPISTKREANGSIPLEPQSFAAVLTLCRNSSRPLHVINFFASVLQRPESQGGASIIDRAHVEQVLQSLIAAAVPASSDKGLELLEWMLSQEVKLPSSIATKIRPTYSTFNLLISHICRIENNWQVATRTFDLMTGYHCHDFMDGVERLHPRLDARSHDRNISPTPEVLSSMMRIAVNSQDRANVRQALRIIHYFRILAQAVLEGIEFLSSSSGQRDKPRHSDVARWKVLKSEAREVLGSNPPGTTEKEQRYSRK
ncbi:hypothetical protein GYMLUDRAFT_69175 [Collybiopsis luxurians FD-317 M1]|nr:hypothetical protein GYMLUDRAFT_69175 [Collybiopsis luxurians FD-317 M1]